MDIASEAIFDGAAFQRVLNRGASRRFSSTSRASSGRSDGMEEAIEAMREFAETAKRREKGLSFVDVVAGYLDVSPAAHELFAALALSSSRTAVCAGALDCLLAIAEYASPTGSNHGPVRISSAVSSAKSIVKDVVKGRANIVSDVLSHHGTVSEASNANKALLLLNRVASSHPLLAKETVNRIDLGARNVAPALCNKAAKATRHSFCELLRTLLTSGDHDVIWTLSTRMRQALISCLRAYSPTPDSESVPPAEVNTIVAILYAMETKVLSCPNHLVAKSAFEPPILDSVARIAVERRTASSSLCDLARALMVRVIERPDVVATAHVVRVLVGLPVNTSQDKLKFVIDCIVACPRAARMLLQTGPYVLSAPRLSSAWLASCAVICTCVRQLQTPTHIFNRTSFFERCWNHESDLVRHKGLLIASHLCKLVLEHPNAGKIARLYLPPCQQVEVVLKKSHGSEPLAHQLYGAYRILFRNEFDDAKTDAIRIAMEAGFGTSPHMLESVIRSSLQRSPNEALSTIFHRHIFSFLLQEDQTSKLLHDILLSTGLFPPCTEHEIYIWVLAAGHTAQGPDELREFEAFVAQAWEKPYVLYDDTYPAGHISLLTASALRRVRKLVSNPMRSSTPRHHGVAHGSFRHILMTGLTLAQRTCRKESTISRAIRSACTLEENPYLFAKLRSDSALGALKDLCNANRSPSDLTSHYDALSECDDGDASYWSSDASKIWRMVDEIDKNISVAVALSGAVGRRLSRTELLQIRVLRADHLALLIRLAEVDRVRVGNILDQYIDLSKRVLSNVNSENCCSDSKSLVLYSWISQLSVPLKLRQRILSVILSTLAKASITMSFQDKAFVALNNFIRDLSDEKGVAAIVPTLIFDLLPLISRPGNADICDVLDSLLKLCSHPDAETRAISRLSVERGFKDLRGFELSGLSLETARRLAILCGVVPGILQPIFQAFSLQSFENIGDLLPLVQQLLDRYRADDGEMQMFAELIQAKLFTNRFKSTKTDRPQRLRQPARFDNSLSDLVYAILASSIKLCELSTDMFSSYLVKATSVCQQGSLPTAFEGSLLCAVFRAWFREPMTFCHRFAGQRARVLDLLASILDLTQEHADALPLANEILLACRNGAVLQGAGVQEIENIERSITHYLRRAVDFMHLNESCVRALAAAFEFDIMLDDAAVFVLDQVVHCGENRGQLSVEKAWIGSLSALVCAVTRRLSARRVDSRIAQSMASLEAIFCEQGLYLGSLSSEDCSIRLAMERIASVLKGSDARRRFKLPERRDNLFHVRSAQVIQLLDTKRLGDTADMLLELAPDDIEKRQSPTELPISPSPGYDPLFILRVLQKAASEASQSPKSAVLDLGALARTGLVDVAICGLASNSHQIRILAYAALAALARAVGPSGKVPPDFAAALYRDRRQLAYALELLQASIREPLVRILPLFASFYCVALSVMLHPTHKINKELMRFLLRSSVQDVHDAEGVCYLLREPSKQCHELALQIMQRGIRSPEDHHVARRRRFYDRALTLLDLREHVVTALLPMVGRLNGQVAADLVRSLGILSWLMSAPTQDGANMNVTKDLELLTRLADCLPAGALPSRYAPSFLQTLEVLSANGDADSTRVEEATAAVSRLAPRVLRLLDFDDGKYMHAGLVRHVHAKRLRRATPELIQEAIAACCTEEKQDRAFPITKEDRHAIQAFIADQLLKNPRLRTNDVRSALACLALDGQQMTIWGLVACVSVQNQAALTPTLHQLAESIPGSVEEDALDLSLDHPWDSVLTDELRLSISEMLLSR
jgi:hypothetical protein